MKRAEPPIIVRTPCPKQWAEMRGDSKTRFCDHCQLHVHNLSAMGGSDLSAIAHLQQTKRICVTYALRADGTMITRRDSIIEVVQRSCHRIARWLLSAISSVAFGAGIFSLLLLS